MNVIKTMLTITVLFVVCWFPNTIFYLITTIDQSLWSDTFYYASVLMAFLNTFYYARVRQHV